LHWLLLDFIAYLKIHFQKIKKAPKKESFVDQFKEFMGRLSKSKLFEEETLSK
jgi:hypothetical protein